MNNSKIFLLVFCFLFSSSAMADQASETEAAKLLDSMDMQTALDRMIDVALDTRISQKPEIAPYRNVMRAFFAKYMSYASLKPQMIAIYANEFSASELAEARAFYATPTGQAFISKMPALMAKGAEMGAQSVKDHIPELQEAIENESKRIKELQGASQSP
jgi:hypothetical protein